MDILGWIIFLLLILFLLTTVLASKSLAPWVPMWSKDLQRVFELSKLQPGERFYDLGCGNGKTVIAAAKQAGANATGIELSFPLYVVCFFRRLLQPTHIRKNIHFRFANLFKQNISNANVIYVFGMPHSLQVKLKQKLETELQPGTRIVSYTFPIQGLTPVTVSKPAKKELAIYLYII